MTHSWVTQGVDGEAQVSQDSCHGQPKLQTWTLLKSSFYSIEFSELGLSTQVQRKKIGPRRVQSVTTDVSYSIKKRCIFFYSEHFLLLKNSNWHLCLWNLSVVYGIKKNKFLFLKHITVESKARKKQLIMSAVESWFFRNVYLCLFFFFLINILFS